MIKPGELKKKNKQQVDIEDDPKAEAEVIATPLVMGWVLDESGSMENLRSVVIDGFNEYLKTNKKNALAKFILTRVGGTVRLGQLQAIADCPELTMATYRPDGGTPLYDGIVQTIEAIQAGEEAPRLVIILTDGMNNQGRATLAEVRALIETKTATGLWTFVYVGANQDAWARSADIGVPTGNTRSWQPDVNGVIATSQSLGRMSDTYTQGATAARARGSSLFSTASSFADAGETTCLVCGETLDSAVKHNCKGAPAKP